MRLSQYAKQMNVSYKTAFRWWKAGRLDAYQLDTGTIIVRDPKPETHALNGIALYARVSPQGQKADLERLKTYAAYGTYDFMVDADDEIRELEQEAERNGYVLYWTCEQDKHDFAYTCEQMTSQEYEH
jgi:predicted site-specific integrase-resolvase